MAIRELVNSVDNIVLVIAGEGGMKPKLQQMAKELKIESKVKLLGAVPHDKIHTYYALCDVFVLPSIYEALSISILEAMSCGKPVIASNVGGIPELIINNKNGYLVSPNNPEKFADAILLLYNNPEKAYQIGRENRLKAEKLFSLNFMADKILKIYERRMKEKMEARMTGKIFCVFGWF
jgi:glycosyltransferase involved in cell wall biosynthesis